MSERVRVRGVSVEMVFIHLKRKGENQLNSWVNFVPLKYLWMVKLIFHLIWTEKSRHTHTQTGVNCNTPLYYLSLELFCPFSLSLSLTFPQIHAYNLYCTWSKNRECICLWMYRETHKCKMVVVQSKCLWFVYVKSHI